MAGCWTLLIPDRNKCPIAPCKNWSLTPAFAASGQLPTSFTHLLLTRRPWSQKNQTTSNAKLIRYLRYSLFLVGFFTLTNSCLQQPVQALFDVAGFLASPKACQGRTQKLELSFLCYGLSTHVLLHRKRKSLDLRIFGSKCRRFPR